MTEKAQGFQAVLDETGKLQFRVEFDHPSIEQIGMLMAAVERIKSALMYQLDGIKPDTLVVRKIGDNDEAIKK